MAPIASDTTNRRHRRRKQRASLPICCCCLLMGLACWWLQVTPLQVACEPSQQQQRASGGGAPSSSELTGQDLFAAEGLAALGAYGRGAYANTKRARKMSAFMPMRGRKDGRELQLQLQQPSFAAEQLDGGQAPRELEPSSQQELRLVRSMGSMRGPAPTQSNGLVTSRFATTPRQFVEQLELIGEQLARRRAGLAAATGSGSEPIMEAKFRRAFHPMRGKRFEGAPADSVESGGEDFDSDSETSAMSPLEF